MTAPLPLRSLRWQALTTAVGARVVGVGRAEMACPVHGGDKPNAFAISVGDESDYPLLRCRSACDSDAEGWLLEACAALVALGAPPDALPPTKGSHRVAVPAIPMRRVAAAPDLVAVVSEAQVDDWADALWRDNFMREALCRKWDISEEVLAEAEVGWEPAQARFTLPVRDLTTGAVVQVICRRRLKTDPVSPSES